MTRHPAILCLLGALSACTATETGNPVTSTEMALTSHTSDPAVAGFDPAPDSVVIDALWLGLGDLRFVLNDVCDDIGDTRIDLPGPHIEELAAGPAALPMFDLDEGAYCRVRVPLERVRLPLPAGAPPELEDHSVLVSGVSAAGTPFVLRSRITPEADVRSRGAPFAIDDARRSLVLSFDVAVWFADVDLDAGAVGVDGVLRIDDGENTDLLDAVETKLEEALELYDDVNGDGDRDDGDLRLADALP